MGSQEKVRFRTEADSFQTGANDFMTRQKLQIEAALTHIDIAGRLTDRAIEMLFDGDDLLFVMTIAHPGNMLFHDEARAAFGEENATAQLTREMIAEGVMMPDGSPIKGITDVLGVLRRSGNSLKHTSNPPVLDHSAVYATLAGACGDAKSLGVVSRNQRIFMMWYYGISKSLGPKPWPEAIEMFPGLAELDFANQLRRGQEQLRGS